ncbi:hypothetical protein [uncultured Mediterranean phage uvDeep-CGR2-AD3-C191]|nr:hypothetical protein [uncultured Mediterranean phage uvDeep-CGR2-AD3-C191]
MDRQNNLDGSGGPCATAEAGSGNGTNLDGAGASRSSQIVSLEGRRNGSGKIQTDVQRDDSEKLYTLTQHEKRLGLSYWRLRKACLEHQKRGGDFGMSHYLIDGRYLCTIGQVDAFLARHKK